MLLIQEILNKLGIEQLNEMQLQAHKTIRTGSNTLILSPTGSGKTLAYLLPVLEKINPSDARVQAVILVPSRELALQTHQVAARIGGVRTLPLYGGRSAMEDHRDIKAKQPQVVIATPGRMLDHLTKGNVVADAVMTLVIDEFDKSLELGFHDEMKAVADFLTHVRQRILLSATDSDDLPGFIGDMRNAQRLDYRDKQQASQRIWEYVVQSPVKDKLETLGVLLRSLGSRRSIVFLGFRESVERVENYLARMGFGVTSFHGGMEQKIRERNLFRFVSGSANILVSTDLASRGLDIPAVDNAIHYHLPMNAETYTHRIGRTARWDAEGASYLILGPEEQWDGTEEMTRWEAPEKLPMVEQPVWETLYIGRGKRDKLSRGDVAGFLMRVAGLEKQDVGQITLHDHHAFVAITRTRVSETLARIRNQKIKGMKTIIERAMY
ncbi:MAG: DEAD/DEAH box helicase [Bacteroidaceae bacterium]|nr:DEAD/DEAH box helicase [Bacteroidaceae bacterium]